MLIQNCCLSDNMSNWKGGHPFNHIVLTIAVVYYLTCNQQLSFLMADNQIQHLFSFFPDLSAFRTARNLKTCSCHSDKSPKMDMNWLSISPMDTNQPARSNKTQENFLILGSISSAVLQHLYEIATCQNFIEYTHKIHR